MPEMPVSPYLEQEVLSASPAKLRWLLINKALQLSKVVQQLWQEKNPDASNWTVWLRDVLNELLAGVHGKDELAERVTDLYIFMIKVLTEAERDRSPAKLAELQSLLEIESETWLLVQQKLAGSAPTGGALAGGPSLAAAVVPTFNLDAGTEGAFSIDA